MDAELISRLTSTLLVKRDSFVEQNGYIDKKINVSGKLNLVLFRQNKDYLELINVTENEMIFLMQIKNHDMQHSESLALQIYHEVKEKLLNLESRVVENQGGHKTSEVKKSNNQADITQLSGKGLDNYQITKQVRIQLKIEGKLGVDFAKLVNGLSVAHGDYIKLNKAYSQKDGLFKTTNLPKDAEIKITGHTTKKGETYATGVCNNSNVELKIKSVEARYGDQYVKYYETNPEVKQAVNQRVTAQQTTFKSLSDSRVQELSQSNPKQDKPTSGIKF